MPGTMPTTVDTSRLRASLRRMEREVRNPSAFYKLAAAHMRDYVRATIRKQGRRRPYAPLSELTRKAKGKQKALLKFIPLIRSRHSRESGEVYVINPDLDWSIDQHHTGWSQPPVIKKRMVVRNRQGGVVAAMSGRQAFRVPGREIWPTKTEVTNEVRPLLKDFLDKAARKNWR